MNLYIYSYNNYYNRIVKKVGDNISDYQEFLHYGPVQGVYGFTPGDGVNTQQVIGSNSMMYDGKGDYLIAHNPDTGEIDSRWFIISVDRTRNGQWILTLHRDLIADYYDIIVDSPMFIEKATLNADSPLIFNSENMSVNQIKTNETLLMDKSKCAWLVGYYDKGSEALQGTVATNGSDIPYTQLATNIEDWEYYKYTTISTTKETFLGYPTSAYYRIRATWLPDQVTYSSPYRFNTSIFSTDGTTTSSLEDGNSYKNWGLYFPGTYGANSSGVPITVSNLLKQQYGKTGVLESLKSQILYYTPDNLYSQADTDNLLYTLNGNIVRDLDGKFFKINVKNKGTQSGTINLTGQLQLDLKNIALAAGFTQTGTRNDYYQLTYTSNKYQIELIEQFDLETTYNITGNKLITTDAPWNIFAIPYSDTLVIKDGSDDSIILENTSKDVSISVAMAMQAQQASRIHDIQILPYCPVPHLITDDNEITITNEKEYSLIVSGGETHQVLGIIFNVPESRFTTNLEGYSIQSGQTAIEKKLNNECDKWRLTSPNYSNYFDFSVEKNGGISYFNVDCDYKPFTPYIHINPNFSNLYGEDFNDVRGLVCGGDFSLSQIIDQWEQYQIQNKNFQNIFDRQIQNMEITQDIQRKQELWSLGAGSLSGAASGALMGSMIAPGVGGAIGAAVGGVASLAGGAQDIYYSDKLRAEALDYTKDNFSYQLGNIQALPNTISKVSALNNNNKLFPILEYYTCKKEEKRAFINKIAWNGMTTMVIGKINDFVGNFWEMPEYNISSEGYIKGQLIRLELPVDHKENQHSEDYQIVNAISGELYKGVYIK